MKQGSFSYTDFEVIDAHTHIFPQKIAQKATVNIGKFYDLAMYDEGSSEALVKRGEKYNIKKFLVCSTATVPEQTTVINDFIKNECDKHPEFIGLGTLHPDFDDIEGEVDRIISLGLKGVKLHPDFQQFVIDDKKAYRIYEAIEGRLPLLIHMGDERYEYSRPIHLKKVMEDFPELKATATHLGGYQRWEEALECLAGKFENLRYDTSSSQSILPPEFVKKLIDAYGLENCFFGTDFPMWDFEREAEALLSVGYSYDEYKKLFSENFKAFYGID
ncbi:MAG: amidohydrolase family protein [Oscillospiraceae bacterium]